MEERVADNFTFILHSVEGENELNNLNFREKEAECNNKNNENFLVFS